MDALLGLRLEDAQAVLRAQGIEARVISTAAPRVTREGGTLRVIRVRDGEITVSAFQDVVKVAEPL